MTPEDLARLGSLLLGQRLVALGVVAEGEPIVGLLPYAVAPDRAALIVQSSSLARHSKGLVPGAPWSGMIHEPDSAETDPLQVPRLQLEGVVDALSGARPEFQPSARAFLARFPQAAMTLQSCPISPSIDWISAAAGWFWGSEGPSTCRGITSATSQGIEGAV